MAKRERKIILMILSNVPFLFLRPLSLPNARKLLSFTDNRQDASLQSGHLNDFIEVGLLRGAKIQSADFGGSCLTRDPAG